MSRLSLQPGARGLSPAVVEQLRDLPVWDDAPGSRRALAEALFERVEVLGLRRMRIEPTPSAVGGLVRLTRCSAVGSSGPVAALERYVGQLVRDGYQRGPCLELLGFEIAQLSR